MSAEARESGPVHKPIGQDDDGRHLDCEVCGGRWPCDTIKAEWRKGARRVMFKYPLLLTSGPQTIEVPAVADIRHLAEQSGRPTIWAEVNTSAPVVTRTFQVFATGEDIDIEARQYIGTIHLGWTVWHVYEMAHSGRSRDQ